MCFFYLFIFLIRSFGFRFLIKVFHLFTVFKCKKKLIKLIYFSDLFQQQESLQISLPMIQFTGILKRSQTTEHPSREMPSSPGLLFQTQSIWHTVQLHGSRLYQNKVRKQNLLE